MRYQFIGFIFLILASIAKSTVATPGGVQYRLVHLADSDGGEFLPLDMNNHGEVVGLYRKKNSTNRPFYWHKGKTTLLDTLANKHATAGAIGDDGIIVGSSRIVDDVNGAMYRPVFWKDFKISELPTADDFTDGQAYKLGPEGQIFGTNWFQKHEETAYPPSDPTRETRSVVTIWNGDELATIEGSLGSESLFDSNSKGTLLGSFKGGSLRYANGKMRSIEYPNPVENSFIKREINDEHLVIGTLSRRSGEPRYQAVVWNDDQLTHLPPLPGALGATARTINNHGMAAGASCEEAACWYPERRRGVVWSQDGQVTDLNETIDSNSKWHISHVRKIKDNGWMIVGIVSKTRGPDFPEFGDAILIPIE